MYTIEQIRQAGIDGEISSIDVEHLITVLIEDKKEKYKAEIHHLIELKNFAQNELDTTLRSITHYKGRLSIMKAEFDLQKQRIK